MEQRLDGRYEVLRLLGTGGFGNTYLAQDLRIPGHPYCVVKQLHSLNIDTQNRQLAQQLFQREAETLAKLGHHDQIPRLLAYFTEDEEFYLVEDYIEGQSLEQELQSGEPWPEKRVSSLIQDILEVLAFVHRHGVIHRDLKPENLIRRSLDGKIVLIDFGAIKQVQQGEGFTPLMTGTQIGTLGFMPPEQSQGKPRPNSDIYALGMIGIQALTGVPAYGLPDDPETGEVIWQNRAQVSQGFAQILSQMVKYHFQHRYQSVTDVQQAIAQYSTTSKSPSLPSTSVQTPSPPPPVYAAGPSLSGFTGSTVAVSPAPVSNSAHRSGPEGVSPRRKRNGVLPWITGMGVAIIIPILGGGAYLLTHPNQILPTFKTAPEGPASSQPCMASVSGNIRSEPTSSRGNGNIISSGQGERFELGRKQTAGGWIEIQLRSGKTAWTHLDVVSNEAELKRCIQAQGIRLQTVADIPRPAPPRSRPVVQPSSPSPTPSPSPVETATPTPSSEPTPSSGPAPSSSPTSSPAPSPSPTSENTPEIPESSEPMESSAPEAAPPNPSESSAIENGA